MSETPYTRTDLTDMLAQLDPACPHYLPRLLRQTVALMDRAEKLEGIQPEFPPRPPHGDGTPRYGIRWNGPEAPLAVPMEDGYWTPWHLAVLRVAAIEQERDVARENHAAATENWLAAERLGASWVDKCDAAEARERALSLAVRRFVLATRLSDAARDLYEDWTQRHDPGSDYRTLGQDRLCNALAGLCTWADDECEAAYAALTPPAAPDGCSCANGAVCIRCPVHNPSGTWED